MRLHSIKLAGFKSFVEPTTVLLPSNLTAVVGPNGCGKSNIIDAVRWVMGESSAKQLRGESLDDVIFNGAATRKPVSHASIELVFDNSAGKLEGQYSSYAEIAVRREITRDGQSNYFLNNTRCRRRDITDLFLGTGLGPRSYAIIEQGMISRLIEAKPEELRNYIEEAAGISKYKERRRETELRIKHTQENLDRLNDIREELTKQINHLQRQANAAERYKNLKQEERLLKAQIQTLKWRLINDQLAVQRINIQEQETLLMDMIAAQQQLEADLVRQRELQSDAATQNSETQAQFYQISTEVSRLEQALQNQREKQQQLQQEQEEVIRNSQQTQQQLVSIAERCEELQQDLVTTEPQYQQAKTVTQNSQQALLQAERELQEWQARWDVFNQQMAQISQRIEVENTRIQHLQQRLQTNQQRISRLQNEKHQHELELSAVAADNFEQHLLKLQAEHAQHEQRLEETLQGIAEQREQNQRLSHELDTAKNQGQDLRAQEATLEALQQVALGQREAVAMEWIKQHGLTDLPRLAQVLQVEAGWEQAVETVLERYLQAVCVTEFTSLEAQLSALPQANLSLVAQTVANANSNSNQNINTPSQSTNLPTLLSKLQAPLSLTNLIANIYVAENLAEGLKISQTLAPHESVVTRDGMWFGNGWLYVAHKADAKTGVLQRERELIGLRQAITEAAAQVENYQQALVLGQRHLHELEEQREEQRRLIANLVHAQAEVRTKHQVHQAHVAQVEQRAQQISAELGDCNQQLQADQEVLAEAQKRFEEAQGNLKQQELEKEAMAQAKAEQQEVLEIARKQAYEDQSVAHQLELRLQAAKLQLDTAVQTQGRLEQQQQELIARQATVQQVLEDSAAPVDELKEKLQMLSQEKASAEELLAAARQHVERFETELRKLEQQRHQTDQALTERRNALEQARLAGQAQEVRAKSLEEQIAESEYELPALLAELPADAQENVWEDNLNQIVRKIERLGPINLAAIDEFTEQSQRKETLDQQYNDLMEALATLDDAMKKMDQETRTRFKETYDMINENFQKLFPILFGGGQASLQLGDEDLLVTGISLMAQPPGKRNSTIHLLSGGEKALTAIALVFALFQLNPAPFCMLDEVDAPLDDANVGRFCNLVKKMSEEVQFIFISHNKLAIEMADQLAGVTMHEAGVSRMVAVDIEEAIAMATA